MTLHLRDYVGGFNVVLKLHAYIIMTPPALLAPEGGVLTRAVRGSLYNGGNTCIGHLSDIPRAVANSDTGCILPAHEARNLDPLRSAFAQKGAPIRE